MAAPRPFVVGLADDACARRAGTVRRLVCGTIVDHENFVPGGDCPDAGDYVGDGILFVEGRNNDRSRRWISDVGCRQGSLSHNSSS